MTAPSYDHNALWIKAKLFLNHAMDSGEPRGFDERALWATFALELLAKAALARISPLLIAEPTEDGTHLLMASGLLEGDARFTTIRAKTIYARCHKAFKPFSEKEALTITRGRNEYLHGAGIGFTGIPADVWWARYWAQAAILVNALDADLGDLVGPDRLGIVEAHIARNAKNLEHRVEMLIERAKQRLAQYQSGVLPMRIAREWDRPLDLSAALSYKADEICPACGANGVLEGEDVQNSELHYEQTGEEDFDVWMELTVGAEYFSCPTCKLVLDSYELLEAAGVSTTFEAAGAASDYVEPEYGND